MPRGDKSAYTDKQTRQAEHIEEGYEKRGVPEEEAERRAWATVNKMTGGGKKSGAGRGKTINTAPAKKGGRKGGAASAARSFAERSASAKKAAQTRKRRAAAAHK
jgi:plasmid stabilization system protein ParE